MVQWRASGFGPARRESVAQHLLVVVQAAPPSPPSPPSPPPRREVSWAEMYGPRVVVVPRSGRTVGDIQADARARVNAKRRPGAPCPPMPFALRTELRELGIEADGWCAGSDADRARMLERADALAQSRRRPGAPCDVPAHVRHLVPADAYCAADAATQDRMVAEAEAIAAGDSPMLPDGAGAVLPPPAPAPAPAPAPRRRAGAAALGLGALGLLALAFR
jgi:hypothetical protein